MSMDETSGFYFEPESLIAHAADAALRAAQATLREYGAEPVKVVVLLEATNVPEGERTVMTAASGEIFREQRVLLTELLTPNAAVVAKELGLSLDFVRLGENIGRG